MWNKEIVSSYLPIPNNKRVRRDVLTTQLSETACRNVWARLLHKNIRYLTAKFALRLVAMISQRFTMDYMSRERSLNAMS